MRLDHFVLTVRSIDDTVEFDQVRRLGIPIEEAPFGRTGPSGPCCPSRSETPTTTWSRSLTR